MSFVVDIKRQSNYLCACVGGCLPICTQAYMDISVSICINAPGMFLNSRQTSFVRGLQPVGQRLLHVCVLHVIKVIRGVKRQTKNKW